MKRLLIAILVLLPFAARAQQVVPPGYVLVDSLHMPQVIVVVVPNAS